MWRRVFVQAFMQLVNKNSTCLAYSKLVSITTDGTLKMAVSSSVALCKHCSLQDFVHYHCSIHKQPLCRHSLNIKDVMDVAMKIVNSICVQNLFDYSVHRQERLKQNTLRCYCILTCNGRAELLPAKEFLRQLLINSTGILNKLTLLGANQSCFDNTVSSLFVIYCHLITANAVPPLRHQ